MCARTSICETVRKEEKEDTEEVYVRERERETKCAGKCTPWCTCEGQRTKFRSFFFNYMHVHEYRCLQMPDALNSPEGGVRVTRDWEPVT